MEAAQAEVQGQAAQEHQQLQQRDAQQQTDPQAAAQPQQEAAEQPQHAGDAGQRHRASCLIVPLALRTAERLTAPEVGMLLWLA